jgi:hypothetical protein
MVRGPGGPNISCIDDLSSVFGSQLGITRAHFQSAANGHGTDKCQVHGYHRFYPLFLAALNADSEFTIVEIGYGAGESMPMWKELFPKAFYVCIDKDVSGEGDGYLLIKADQNNPAEIEAATKKIPRPVRLIVDDGSHHPQHQLTTFSALFQYLLEPGGIYVVEDIETSYWLAGQLYGNAMRYGLFSRWSAIEAFKLAADFTNRAFLAEQDRDLLSYSMMMVGLSPNAAELINMVSFGQNCVVLTKALADDFQFINRNYPHAQCTARS